MMEHSHLDKEKDMIQTHKKIIVTIRNNGKNGHINHERKREVEENEDS